MELKDSLGLFSKVAGEFNVVLLAKQAGPKNRHINKPLKDRINVKDGLPILDALELLEEHDCLVTEKGLVVTRAEAMERPVRILFYMLITELEYSMYKILKQYADTDESLERLRAFQMNDMIREFLKPNLRPETGSEGPFAFQHEYVSKQDMKKDLKAVSSFRNIVMHSNRKMELEAEFSTIMKRKGQLFRLLNAMGQIMDNMKAKKGQWA